jgi:hemerythrin-like domain-containing protein
VEPPFDEVRREHQQILEAVCRLEASGLGERADMSATEQAVAEFLSFFETTIEPHMRKEEADIYPLLDRYLPAEVGSAEAMRHEHETARSLVSLLQAGRRRSSAGEAPENDRSVLVQDLVLLLRDHIRKEDGVINPLLERLLKGAHA